MDGFALPKAGLTQAVFPNRFFMCTTGTLSPFTVHGSFDCTGPAQLADPLLLTNQVAFAKCVSQCLEVLPPVLSA